MTSNKKCTVLVTGGAGFLGQHIVGLLQTYADHVTDIRVIDTAPYVNKLDYLPTKPVTIIVGSITDEKLVQEACKGVHCVMHVASYVDTTLFPDENFSYKINVIGTETIIKACQTQKVQRLIYCSSVGVVTGGDNIYDGTEANTVVLKCGHYFKVYGLTKQQAEKKIIQANCATLRTVSLRPVIIYGELDWRFLGCIIGNYFVQKTGYYVQIDCHNSKAEHAYVGNTAWAFLCADKKLLSNETEAALVSGSSYFICDDSPRENIFHFAEPILRECGLKPLPFSLPQWLLIYFVRVLYVILSVISMFHRVNFSLGIEAISFMTKTTLFKYDKARELLGYKPLYTYEQAKSRTVNFFKNKKNT